MSTRRADGPLLRKLIRGYGQKGTVAEAAKDMDVSKSLLEKLMSGKYESEVDESTQRRMCEKLQVSRNRLWKVVGATEQTAP